jgi:hypothetical protein
LYLAGPALLNPLARAVRAVKFRGHRAAARSLGAALGSLVPLPADALVVPVPLHPTRLRERALVLAEIRAFFSEQSFLEVQTPIRVRAPGVDSHVDAIASAGRYLITSPELAHKRLLVGGLPRIFELARVLPADTLPAEGMHDNRIGRRDLARPRGSLLQEMNIRALVAAAMQPHGQRQVQIGEVFGVERVEQVFPGELVHAR